MLMNTAESTQSAALSLSIRKPLTDRVGLLNNDFLLLQLLSIS